MTLRIVTQCDSIYTGAEGRSLTGYVSRWPRYIGSGAVSDLTMSFGAWMLTSSSNGPALNLGNDIPIMGCSIEYNGVVVPVTFGGNPGIVISDGTSDTHSDSINIMEAFGVPVLEVGACIFVKVEALLASSVHKMPTNARRVQASGGDQVWFYDPAITNVSDTYLPGPYTWTGSLKPGDRGTGYSPIILGVFATPGAKSLFIRGDSISSGNGDAGRRDYGWFNRMCETHQIASLNAAVSSIKIHGGGSDIRVSELYKYCTDALVCGGTNDWGGTAISQPIENVLTSMDTAVAQMKAGGIDKVGVMQVLVRTTTTDDWATQENQTIITGWGAGEKIYDYNQALLSRGYDFVLTSTGIRSPDGFKWATNGSPDGFTADGTHPSPGGYAAMAESNWPIVEAALFSEQEPDIIPDQDPENSLQGLTLIGSASILIRSEYTMRGKNLK